MNLILCGFKQSGKTTIGRVLAKKLKYSFLDIDQEILKKSNKTAITDIYKNLGEAKFRQLEYNIIKKNININHTVISTGGGTVIKSDNLKLLKKTGEIIYLYLEPNRLIKRLKKLKPLPAFIDKNNVDNSILSYINSRIDYYPAISNTIIDTTDKEINHIVDLITQKDSVHGQ